jgi:hypothetical protein
MTRLQMKAVKGGGYTLTVGSHTFTIVLDSGTTEGAYGPIRYREYHVYIDGARVGESFRMAAAAKDFLVPYVERAQEQERRERSTAMFREFAEEKLFPEGVPKGVLAAMEKYTSTVHVVEPPEKPKRATRTKVKTEDKTETPEDVAADVRKATPRRSRAKSTSRTKVERGTTPRRRTSKVKTEGKAEQAETMAPETTEPVESTPEQETITAPEPAEPEASAEVTEAASA